MTYTLSISWSSFMLNDDLRIDDLILNHAISSCDKAFVNLRKQFVQNVTMSFLQLIYHLVQTASNCTSVLWVFSRIESFKNLISCIGCS